MKIIDLLNKIANGEEVPKKIKYQDKVYYYYSNMVDLHKYETISTENRRSLSLILDNEYLNLNDIVEIIEEEKKIPEKIKDKYTSQISKVEIAQKLNEIIDYLESKGE